MLSNGDQHGAEDKLNASLKFNSADPALWFMAGVMERSRFDQLTAAKIFYKSMMMRGDSPEGLASACILGIDLSRDQYSALYYFNALLALADQHPDSIPIHWMVAVMARTLTKNGNRYNINQDNEIWGRITQTGIMEFDKVLSLMSPGAGPVLVHQTMANLLDQADASDAALPHRLEAMKMEPRHWSIQAAAITYRNLDRTDEALALCKLDVSQNSRNPVAHETLGYVLRYQGRSGESIASYEEASRLDPKNALYYEACASESEKLGDYSRAANFMHKASILTPDNRIYRIREARFKIQAGGNAFEDLMKAGSLNFKGEPVDFGGLPRDPWLAAIKKGDLLAVQRGLRGDLLNSGDPENSNQTPLMVASQAGWEQIAAILIKAGARLDDTDSNGDTALHYAVQFRHPRLVKLLLESGAKTDLVDRWKQTPLEMSVPDHNWDAFQLLTEHKANTHLVDGVPMIYAAGHGDIRMMKSLLATGEDVNFHSPRNGMTPLMWTCQEFPHAYMAELLIASGASINAQDRQGRTALHDAINPRLNRPLVDLLLDKGADPSTKDKNGTTPITEARLLGYEDVAVRMESKRGYPEPFLFPAFPQSDATFSDLQKKAVNYVTPILLAQGNPLGRLSEVRPGDRKAARKELEWMFGIGNDRDLRENLKELTSFQPSYRDEAAEIPGLRLGALQGAALTIHSSLGADGTDETAWTKSHIIYLADLGVTAGFLSQQESDAMINDAASEISKRFFSWDDYLRSFQFGARIHNGWDAGRYSNICKVIAANAPSWQ